MYANLSLWFVWIKADSDLVYSKGVKLQEKGAILQFPNPTGEKENIAHKKKKKLRESAPPNWRRHIRRRELVPWSPVASFNINNRRRVDGNDNNHK